MPLDTASGWMVISSAVVSVAYQPALRAADAGKALA
jgi:hypothetical protein